MHLKCRSRAQCRCSAECTIYSAPPFCRTDDEEDWEEMLQIKASQLRVLLASCTPDGTVHPDDEIEIEHVLKQRRSVSTRRMDMPDLVWDKVEQGRYYMSRAQYNLGNEQL